VGDDMKYKYNEDVNIQKFVDYINGTYGQHYVGNGDIQTVDFWESLGSLETTSRDSALNYIILMMYANPDTHEQETFK
jgi:hypothetical protein